VLIGGDLVRDHPLGYDEIIKDETSLRAATRNLHRNRGLGARSSGIEALVGSARRSGGFEKAAKLLARMPVGDRKSMSQVA
jgi:hypothetical protein